MLDETSMEETAKLVLKLSSLVLISVPRAECPSKQVDILHHQKPLSDFRDNLL